MQLLKKTLGTAHEELEEIKLCHEREVTELKKAMEIMKNEIRNLREEKTESIALQSYGIDEYSNLAHEVVKLRTEIDRVTYLYTKEKRQNSNRNLPSFGKRSESIDSSRSPI